MLGGAYCVLINPGGSGKYARGDFYSCTGMDTPETNNCLLKDDDPGRFVDGAPAAARKADLQGTGAPRAQVSGRPPLAPGELCLLDTPRQLRRRGQRRVRPDEPGRDRRLRLSAAPAEFLRAPLFSTGRIDFRFAGYYRTPLGLSVGLDGYVLSGAPLDRWGYFNSSNFYYVRLVPRGSAGRMPTLWEANLTLEYPLPRRARDGHFAGLRLQSLQQPDRDRPGPGLVHRAAVQSGSPKEQPELRPGDAAAAAAALPGGAPGLVLIK